MEEVFTNILFANHNLHMHRTHFVLLLIAYESIPFSYYNR
jgi:hypothetical protein